jgi:predicted nucleic acid-binding Zn ribbon protein
VSPRPSGGSRGGDPTRVLRRRRDRPSGLRPAGGSVASFASALAPQTLLADVQRVWEGAVGPVVAAEAEPTSAQGGTVTVTCRSSTWASELSLMAPEVVERLNEALPEPLVAGLRCQVAATSRWARDGRRDRG